MWHPLGIPRPDGGSDQEHEVQWMNINHPHIHPHHHPHYNPSVGSSQLGQWRQLSSHLAICHHELEQSGQLGGETLVPGSTLLPHDSFRWPEYSNRHFQHHHCPLHLHHHHHHHQHNPAIVNRSWLNRGQINNSNQLHHHHQFQLYPNIPPSIGGMWTLQVFSILLLSLLSHSPFILGY